MFYTTDTICLPTFGVGTVYTNNQYSKTTFLHLTVELFTSIPTILLTKMNSYFVHCTDKTIYYNIISINKDLKTRLDLLIYTIYLKYYFFISI